LIVVLLTSWLRKHLSLVTWRALHLFATPAFILAMVHGIFTGTDSARPWLWWTYLITGSIVLFLLLVRAFTFGVRPERKPLPAGTQPRTVSPRPAPVGGGSTTAGAEEGSDVVAVGR
jgi:DMSO/TMAO reductase YedYZ heme-binding membrane subunit